MESDRTLVLWWICQNVPAGNIWPLNSTIRIYHPNNKTYYISYLYKNIVCLNFTEFLGLLYIAYHTTRVTVKMIATSRTFCSISDELMRAGTSAALASRQPYSLTWYTPVVSGAPTTRRVRHTRHTVIIGSTLASVKRLQKLNWERLKHEIQSISSLVHQ